MSGVAVNGLGRIGRIAVRRLGLERPGLLAAVNDPAPLEQVLHLLQRDSIHGVLPQRIAGETVAGVDQLILGDHRIPLFHTPDPALIPWPETVGLVVEASGRFTRREAAARHLRGSVTHVVIGSPSPNADATIIAPVNGDTLDLAQHRVISNASCTAHATAPLLRVLEDAFGLAQAGMSTVHVVTNDQRLLDTPHTDRRRARAAFQSIIPTTSSAIGALRQAMPALPPGFDGLALRVPTLSVNLVDLTVLLAVDAEPGSVQAAFRTAAEGAWKGIIALAEPHTVSCDITGRRESVVVDLDLTLSLGPRFVKVYGWHDNETGYAARLLDLVLDLVGRI